MKNMVCHVKGRSRAETVFGDIEFRRIFGPNRDEAIGVWEILQNKEQHSLTDNFRIVSQIREDEMGRVRSAHGDDEKYVQNGSFKP